MENISTLLSEKGTRFYKNGKLLLKISLVSVIVVIVVCIGALMMDGLEWAINCLAIRSAYGVVNLLMVLTYLGIIIGGIGGSSMYYWGLHFMGLGQIAKNTEG